MEKTATELFGTSEYALRLVPLIAGIVSVLMFRDLANKVLTPPAADVALALFAVAPALVYYSSEAKQYGVDVAVVVGLTWFLPRLLDGALTTGKSLGWGASAMVLVWCSFPAAFAAGGVSLVVVVVRLHRRQPRGLAIFIASSLYWVVSFAIEYAVSLRQLHSNRGLESYWSFAFPPRPFGLGATLSWFGHDVHTVARYPWDLAVFPLAATLLIIGLATLLRRRPPLGMLIVLLAGVMVVAGIAHSYPLADRMVLFSLPFVCLALAATVLVSRQAAIQLLFVGLVLVVSVPEFGSAASATVHPYTKTEAREAYVYVQQHEQTGRCRPHRVGRGDDLRLLQPDARRGRQWLHPPDRKLDPLRQRAPAGPARTVEAGVAGVRHRPGLGDRSSDQHLRECVQVGGAAHLDVPDARAGRGRAPDCLLGAGSGPKPDQRSELAAGSLRMPLGHCHPDGPVGVVGAGSPIGFGNGMTSEASSTSVAEASWPVRSRASSGSRTR